MGVDRGLGNLSAVFSVSGHSVNWDEVIEWYLDGPGSSYKECGPTFRYKPILIRSWTSFTPDPKAFFFNLTTKSCVTQYFIYSSCPFKIFLFIFQVVN